MLSFAEKTTVKAVFNSASIKGNNSRSLPAVISSMTCSSVTSSTITSVSMPMPIMLPCLRVAAHAKFSLCEMEPMIPSGQIGLRSVSTGISESIEKLPQAMSCAESSSFEFAITSLGSGSSMPAGAMEASQIGCYCFWQRQREMHLG